MQNGPSFRLRPSSKQRQALKSSGGADQPLQRQLYSLQTNNRMNELQSSLINFKNNVETRFSRITDPRAEFKVLLDRETNINKQLTMKVSQLQEALFHFREGARRNDEIVNATLLEVQKRLEVTEYKARTAEKQLQGVLNLRTLALPQPLQSPLPPSSSSSQLSILRELLTQQKQIRQSTQQSLSRQLQSVLEQQVHLQRSFNKAYTEQHLQQEKMEKQRRQAQILQAKAKNEQQGNQINQVKGMIGTVEKKLSEEMNSKIKGEGEVKGYIDVRVERLREEIMLEQKMAVQGQTLFFKETKDSVQSLYALVTANKQQTEQALSATQALTADNIRNLSKSLDLVKQNLTRRIDSFAGNQNQSGGKLNQLTNRTMQSLRLMEERVRELEDHIQIAQDKLDRANVQAFDEIIKKIEQEQMMNNTWKTDLERKNLHIFKEISGTLKVLQGEITKERDQSVARDTARQKDLQAHQKTFTTEMKKYVEGLIAAFNHQFQLVIGQLEILMELVNVSRNQSQKTMTAKMQKSIQQLKEQQINYTDTKNLQLVSSLQKQISKSTEAAINRTIKQSTYLNDLINQKQSALATQVAILQSSMKQGQLKIDSQVAAATEKYQKYIADTKESLNILQITEGKNRVKLQETVEANTKAALDVATKRNEFVIQGIKKAIDLNAEKDKAELLGQMDLLKHQVIRTNNTLKYQLSSEFNSKLQDQRSERIDHQHQLTSKITSSQTTLRHSIAQCSSTLQLSIQQSSKSLQKKLLEYSSESTSKFTMVSDRLTSNTDKLATQIYLSQMMNGALFDQINANLARLQQRWEYHDKQIAKVAACPDELDAVQEQFYQMEDKIAKQMENLDQRLVNQIYLERTFMKVHIQDTQKDVGTLIELVEQVGSNNREEIEELRGEIEEVGNTIRADLDKNEAGIMGNFKTIEKAFRHTNDFINILDSRLTMQQLYSKLSDEQLSSKCQSLHTQLLSLQQHLPKSPPHLQPPLQS